MPECAGFNAGLCRTLLTQMVDFVGLLPPPNPNRRTVARADGPDVILRRKRPRQMKVGFAQYTEAGGPPVNASLKFRPVSESLARVARELGVVLLASSGSVGLRGRGLRTCS